MEGYEKVVAALAERDLLVPSWSEGQRARCPSHDDQKPSLSVARGDDGRALVYCFAGCSVYDVITALSLTVDDLFSGGGGRGAPTVQLYTYVDQHGDPLYRVHRTDPKGFWQERFEDGEWKPGLRDTQRVPYRLPEVLRAIAQGEPVYVVEGEKDAEDIIRHGAHATTFAGGAGAFRDEYAHWFKGAHVILWGDNDDAGRRGVSRVRLGLTGTADKVETVWSRDELNDPFDHLAAGYTLDEVVGDSVDLSLFSPIKWQGYSENAVEWLLEPWMPIQARVLGFGAAGSLKSLWAMWLGARLSRTGKRVAYFSLEMPPAKTAGRLSRLDPDPDTFICFTKNLQFTDPRHVDQIIRGLEGYDLIVVDSWSAAHQFGKAGKLSQNDEVAALDNEVFLPIIEGTGATLFILDNVGHDAFDKTGKRVKQAHARGASAKGDKMEMTLWFDRPLKNNNYRVTISCEKMRLNYPTPSPVTVETLREEIEFFYLDGSGGIGSPMWPGDPATLELPTSTTIAGSMESDGVQDTVPTPSPPPISELTGYEARALARLKATFKVMEE